MDGWGGGGDFKGGILGDMLRGGAIESLIYAAPMHGLEGGRWTV